MPTDLKTKEARIQGSNYSEQVSDILFNMKYEVGIDDNSWL